ncbi:MAG: hypothetical protein IT577_16285 [Verrucomicrobiae bacterium]|nr:hypothetical protein [Verrucomicrobiae bacterium]
MTTHSTAQRPESRPAIGPWSRRPFIEPCGLANLMCRAGMGGLALRWTASMVRAGKAVPEWPTVLCLRRSQFARDIDQLAARTRLNYVTVESRYLSYFQKHHVPWERLGFRCTQTFYPASEHPLVQEAKRKNERAAIRLLRLIRGRHRFSAVLTAQTDYWQEDSVRAACGELGVPFLVLSKEHYVSGHLRANRMKDYADSGFRFRGDGIALFGECTVETLVSTGVAPRDRIWITGAPRLDAWREMGGSATPRDTITLLSFSKGYIVKDSYRDALLTFAKVANELGGHGVRFVVKCKNGEDREAAEKVLGESGSRGLRFLVGNHVPLLDRSRLVMGFNSLALLESLLSRAHLAVPHWGDAVRKPHDLVVDPADEGARRVFEFLDSPAAWEALLRRAATEAPPPGDAGERLAFLRRYFHYPSDTTCSAEVEAFLLRFIRPGGAS